MTQPELTFDLQLIRGRPAFDPGTFRPDMKWFFLHEGKKIEIFDILGEIFKIQPQTINVWPDPTRATKNWPGPITWQ